MKAMAAAEAKLEETGARRRRAVSEQREYLEVGLGGSWRGPGWWRNLWAAVTRLYRYLEEIVRWLSLEMELDEIY